MNSYKLYKSMDGEIRNVLCNGADSIPFDPANTDYQTFKAQINDDTAELEDADGVMMTPDEAKAFVATLP